MRNDFRDMIGIPYVHGGRDPRTGLDCWGICREAVRRFGRELPDFEIACYNALMINAVIGEEAGATRWRRMAMPAEGCIVAMAIDPEMPHVVQHLGVYLGDGEILHTLDKRGSNTFRTDDRFFAKKIVGYYQWLG